nr:hypothetical protein [uncultured Albidiferax sp.]
MQGQLDFHDSEVGRITLQADVLTLAFSAALVQARSAETGYVQTLEIACTGATVDGALADAVGRLSHGKLWVCGRVLPALPFPYAAPGPVRLELQFSNGTRLVVSAATLECRFRGDPHFVESFAC